MDLLTGVGKTVAGLGDVGDGLYECPDLEVGKPVLERSGPQGVCAKSSESASRSSASPSARWVAARKAKSFIDRRVTPQRLTTWDTIHSGPAHMSIHEVFERVAERMPTTTLRTVVGLLHLPGGARVEIEPVDHAHAFCERCGRSSTCRPIRRADARHRFPPRVEHDVIFGLCQECFAARPNGS
ncbi:MAG: hypothetical protein ACRDWD_16495 [Acidimicrobiia bacterium]